MIKQKTRHTDKSLINFPVVFTPLMITNPLYRDVKGNAGQAIVRVDTKRIITIASEYYEPLTHIDKINNMEQVLRDLGINFELFDINIGGVSGNRVFLNYILPTYKFDVEGDIFVPFIQIYSAYDRYLSTGYYSGLYNTSTTSAVIVRKGLNLVKRKALWGNVKFNDSMIDIGGWITELGAVRRKLKKLKLDKNVDNSSNIVTAIIEKKKHQLNFYKAKILESYIEICDFSEYSLLNSLMDYVTHYMNDEKKKRSYDRIRHAQILIGDKFLNLKGGLM